MLTTSKEDAEIAAALSPGTSPQFKEFARKAYEECLLEPLVESALRGLGVWRRETQKPEVQP